MKDFDNVKDLQEVKENFWSAWKDIKNRRSVGGEYAGDYLWDVDRLASYNFETFLDLFGNYAKFVAKIVCTKKLVHTLNGWFFFDEKDLELAERVANKKLWNLAFNG